MDLKRKLVTVVLAVCLLASGMISCTNSKEKQQRIIDTFNSFTNAKEFVLITNDDIRLGDTVIDRDRVQYEGTHCLFIFSEADGTWAYANGGEGKVNIVFFEYETETATLVDSITVPGGAFAAEQYGGEFYFRANDPDTEEFKQIYYVYDPDTRETRTVGTDDLPIDIEKSGDHNRSSLYTIQSDMTSSMENKLIVTNGDQTDTVYNAINEGKTFEDGLRTREFEPDCPNYTPRISAINYYCFPRNTFTYKMSILKSSNGNPEVCNRYFYEYAPMSGLGHFIHTYECDGNPIPSFYGEPEMVELPNTAEELADVVWNNLNADNKVSLFVRAVPLDGSEPTEIIINKNV